MYTSFIKVPLATSRDSCTIGYVPAMMSFVYPAHHSYSWMLVLASFLILGLLGGCVSSETTTKDIGVEDPKSTSGLLVRDPQSNALDRLIAQFESNRDDAVQPLSATLPTSTTIAQETWGSVRIRGRTRPASGLSWPAGMGKMLDLPSMSDIELREFLDDLALALQAQSGYEDASDDIARSVPALPTGLFHERLLCHETDQGNRVLRVGCWAYRSRTPRLGVYGAVLSSGQPMQTNPDQAGVETLVGQILANVELARQSLRAVDLDHKTIQLSYVDVPGALTALKGLGIYTIDSAATIPQDVKFDQLPIVLEIAPPAAASTGLVGKSEVAQGQFGATVVPTLASDLNADMIASPAARLMVLFHPAHPEQFGQVQELIDEVIDRPARQIYIESMVIEITEGGLQQLGVEWEFQDGTSIISGGSLSTSIQESLEQISNTLLFTGDSTQNLSNEWFVTIRALLVDGKAKILSRPSVLALNNRQASIRIGEDIPIATSQEGLSGNSSKISFDFKYIPIGILLNIRPRVSEDGREISMMIDTVVSARKPEGDLEIRDEDGGILASAPTVTTRRVQTYARIQNNTPFIIGGLVSTNDIKVSEKVPFLGELPVIGAAFRSESSRQSRNEVIIVLTPYVLPEKLHLSRALPKQTEFMDDEDLELFRRSHRILPRDIVDVSALYTNERFHRFWTAAQNAVRQNFQLGLQPAFYPFSEGRLPAETIIVDKIVYNTLTRLDLGAEISSDMMFLITGRGPGRYDTEYLDAFLAKMPGCDSGQNDFFSLHPDKALAISFYDPYEPPDGRSLISEPVPRLEIVSCADRQAWRDLLWKLNQADRSGRKRYAILIHRPEDILRLQRSIMVKWVLHINGGGGPEASLRNFIPGRILEIPETYEDRAQIIDVQAARYFFHSTSHSYAAAVQKINQAIDELEKELSGQGLRHVMRESPKSAD